MGHIGQTRYCRVSTECVYQFGFDYFLLQSKNKILSARNIRNILTHSPNRICIGHHFRYSHLMFYYCLLYTIFSPFPLPPNKNEFHRKVVRTRTVQTYFMLCCLLGLFVCLFVRIFSHFISANSNSNSIIYDTQHSLYIRVR